MEKIMYVNGTEQPTKGVRIFTQKSFIGLAPGLKARKLISAVNYGMA